MRNQSIDNVRGLAMLVIISWHVVNIHSPWTDMWTMPIFFVVMGIFFKPVDWHTLVFKKTRTLVVPWLFFSIPDFLMRLVYRGTSSVFKVVVNPYEYIHAGSWFVACTLWIYVIAYCLHQIKNAHLRFAVTWVMIVGGFILSNTHVFGHRTVLPLNLHSAICMFVFFEVGRLLKDRVLQPNVRLSALIASAGMCICTADILLLGGGQNHLILYGFHGNKMSS